jgi:uncharacterized membrane protein
LSSEPPAASNPSSAAALPARRRYIDVARGIAVLLMIEAHTVDAWTRIDGRASRAFGDATILGGFAAPLFLWLAGAGVAMSAARTAQRRGSRAAIEAACRRGLEIFALAFLFRLQALVLTPGGALITLFRVDILNVMGPAMIAAGLMWGAGRSVAARTALYGAAAAAVAMVTPVVRASPAVALLPTWLQWYVRPAGELTTFTLLPWAAFVFAGGAVGTLVAAAADARTERRVQLALAAAGAALVALGFWTAARPSIYAASFFWTTSPTWFAIRVGILMLALAGIYFIVPSSAVVERLGRASLFVYWIHVELVYGYASWLWRHRLPLWGTAAAYVAFCVLMYGAIGLRDRLAAWWSGGPQRQRRRQLITT